MALSAVHVERRAGRGGNTGSGELHTVRGLDLGVVVGSRWQVEARYPPHPTFCRWLGSGVSAQTGHRASILKVFCREALAMVSREPRLAGLIDVVCITRKQRCSRQKQLSLDEFLRR